MELENRLGSLQKDQYGLLRIGTTESYSKCLMPRVLSGFQTFSPSMKIALDVGSSEEIERSLLTYRNDVALIGMTKISSKFESIPFLEEDLIYFLPNIIYLSLYKNGFEGEALLRQKNGAKVFVHLYTTTFKEEGEVFISFSFQEIQRLKKLERERLEMERWASLGMMVEEIAHQIRNPIVAIGGYTQRLLKTLSPLPKGKSYRLSPPLYVKDHNRLGWDRRHREGLCPSH
jgi:signal transduction histidine kinase